MAKEHFKVRKIWHVEIAAFASLSTACVIYSPEFSLTLLLLASCLNFKDHEMKEEPSLNTLTLFQNIKYNLL